jgi:hypothetical protein
MPQEEQVPHSLGIKKPFEELNTYRLGDSPEIVSVLKGLNDQLLSAQVENFDAINPVNLYTPESDSDVTFEILPPSTLGERSEIDKNNESGVQISDSQYRRDLKFLEELKHGWGNESVIVGCRLASTSANGEYSYLAVLLKNNEGQVDAVVADTLGKNNAIYVWQRPEDDSRPSNWIEVFSGDKSLAKQNGALKVNHSGSLEGINERVTNLLTMPLEQYEDEYKQRQSIKSSIV